MYFIMLILSKYIKGRLNFSDGLKRETHEIGKPRFLIFIAPPPVASRRSHAFDACDRMGGGRNVKKRWPMMWLP